MGAVFIYGTEQPSLNIPKDVRSKWHSVMGMLVRVVAFANDLKGLTGIDVLSLPMLP
jgi:hypothetical protein